MQVQPAALMIEEGKYHITVKAGSVVEVIDEEKSSDGHIINKEVVLEEDICVFVEDEKFRVKEK